MKVVTQLIRHFWQRGYLSPAEAQYLLDHGFARPRDLPGHEPQVEEEDLPYLPETVVEFPTALEAVEEALRPQGVGRGKRETTGKAITSRQLLARVRREFERREAAMRTAIRLACRFEPCDGWTDSLAILRRAERKRFHSECNTLLRAQPAALGQLWESFDLQPFFGLVKREECLGRVAQSYFALLVLEDPALLGKYGWILQYDEMQLISNLRLIHKRFLALVGALERRHPRRLERALEAGVPPALFWALVLLYNAKRGEKPFDPSSEYGPVAPPEQRTLDEAWNIAAGVDRTTLTPFLIACFSKQRQRNDKQHDAATEELYCPAGWHVPAAAAS